jgi:hypothetical protein
MAVKKKAAKKKSGGADLVNEALTSWAKLNEKLRFLTIPQLEEALNIEKAGKNRKDVVMRLFRRWQRLNRDEQRKQFLAA